MIDRLACQGALGDQVLSEMLQSQIEVATPPCESMQEARDQPPGASRRDHVPGNSLPADSAGAEHLLAVLAGASHRPARLSSRRLQRAAALGVSRPFQDAGRISELRRHAHRRRRDRGCELYLVGHSSFPEQSDTRTADCGRLHAGGVKAGASATLRSLPG
jgi:hypothetical protein